MTTSGEGRAGYEKYFTGTVHTLKVTLPKEDIQEVFDKWADSYERELFSVGCVKHKPMVEVFDTTIQEAMPDKPKCEVKIMEMGAGTGLLGLELNKKGYTNLDALDTSQKMLDEAKKKGVYTKFICSNLTEKRTPGIQDGEYNALILSGVVALVYIKPLAFHEMMRVVSNGGVICFDVLTKDIPDFRPAMIELEKQGLWTLIKEEQVPHYSIEDSALPKSTPVFAFKVNHKE